MPGQNQLHRQLFAMEDDAYREFHCRLIPGVEKGRVIGIRVPKLREFAKTFAKSPDAGQFLKSLPHFYYEEDNLHMMLISMEKDYGRCLEEMKRFLPYVDNWSTCDFAPPRCFGKHKQELLPEIRNWISSGQTYVVRYGVGLLMRLYLDQDFKPEYLEEVASVRSEEYYVNMMIAWYFATALAKQWEAALPYLEGRRLPLWAHRKAIQKAVESYRIQEGQKAYLKGLK
ncbi:MAG: DNA alkylation repair protein [Lachnospiraceae bacterium]|nr:DNA alkylation repair protein [Lachnospiraceae bacterium]